MENEAPDMSNAHMDGDRPACEGEDPEVLADIARATQDLADFLKLHDIDVDYCEADWKDTGDLIRGSYDLILKHPDWQLHYIGGDDLGIDSNFVLFTSKVVSDEVAERIMELIENEGAELLEEVIPPKPVCPKCGKEIEGLPGSYPAVAGGYASIFNGELNINLNEDCHLSDIIDENGALWYCPECDAELFKAGQEAEMTAFLLCDKEYKG